MERMISIFSFFVFSNVYIYLYPCFFLFPFLTLISRNLKRGFKWSSRGPMKILSYTVLS